MSEPTEKTTQRNKVIKKMMIPVLLLVLGLVFAWPDGSDNDVASDQAEASGSSTSPQEDRPPQSKAQLAAERRRNQLPKIELSKILQHDPFTLPSILSQELAIGSPKEIDIARENRERQLRVEEIVQSLKAERINFVFRGKGGVTAVLGSRTIQVGDLIDDEVRVIEIKPEGLILEVIDN